MKKFKRVVFLVPSVLLIFFLSGCQQLNQESLTVAGSTAIQPIIEMAAAKYRQQRPNSYVNVQGGGSETGLSQVAERAIDIGTSDVFASKKASLQVHKLQDHKLAVSGIAVIVNAKTGVHNLSMRQVQKIFTGKITNWQQVGGKKLPITVINRAEGSGTRLNFETLALAHHSSMVAQEQASSGTAYQIVKETAGAVSYVAFPYVQVGVIAPKIDGVKPTVANVEDNHWKLWSYEHLYTRQNPSQKVRDFINYLGSSQVKKIILKLGFIPVSAMNVARNRYGTIETVK